MNLACGAAFWSFSRSSVEAVVATAGIVVPSGTSLCDSLCLIIGQRMRNLSQESILEIVARRLHIHAVSEQYSPTLLQMDSAVEVLEVDDQRAVHEEQKSSLSQQRERQAFVLEYQSRRAQVGTRTTSKAKKWPSAVTLKIAKSLAPPGCSLWHGYTRRQWCGHCPPAKRISASWDMPGGEQAAVRDVCQRLWRQHCELKALPLSVAPEGLFTEQEPSEG